MPAGRSASTSPDPEDDKKSAAESEDENEEEYEIEEILDAKRGHFANGRIGYFVKWKGYGSDENSWVDENDAGNAQALIDAYWNKNQHKKRFPETKPAAKKGRQSNASASAARGSASAARGSASAAGKKRGRPSGAAKDDSDPESEDEGMSVDHPREDSPPTAKRARKGASTTYKSAKSSKAAAPRSTVSDSASPAPSAKPKESGVPRMDQTYQQHASWEKFVKVVDTVELVEGTLMVYFTLTNGTHAGEPSKVCNKRFPQKAHPQMLKFYESNLHWRATEDATPNGEAAESD
ncbi:hypothetical protein BKA70DRAFT_1368469 [Coprinopsis sp. MPI-PUGE-AT-0042]|nr:hypothetical protein BKA70DRAFT_1368469 [Coprinopsis sp. MPI-PUGE-AT-0042]